MFKKLLDKIKYPPAEASGRKNFERAHRALMRNDMTAAAEYNTAAVEAFDQMIAETREAGKDVFPRLLALAGIAYLRENRAEDAEKCFAEVRRRNEKLPEPFIYGGMALAQLDKADKAIDIWREYHRFTDMPVIINTLKEQLRNYEDGEVDMDSLCSELAKAIHKQDRQDYRAQKEYRLLKK